MATIGIRDNTGTRPATSALDALDNGILLGDDILVDGQLAVVQNMGDPSLASSWYLNGQPLPAYFAGAAAPVQVAPIAPGTPVYYGPPVGIPAPVQPVLPRPFQPAPGPVGTLTQTPWLWIIGGAIVLYLWSRR